MEKIDELKHPPIIGERYLVPCIIKKSLEPIAGSQEIDWTVMVVAISKFLN